MKRFLACMILSALAATPAFAQRVPPGTGPEANETLGPGLTSVNWGTMGLNVGVSVGEDGILLIDDQEEAAVPRLKAEIAKLSDRRVRMVINSHWHFDHVGGNAVFAKEGAVIIASTNTRERLMTEQINPVGGGKQKAFAPVFWPQLTFEDALHLHFNGDDVDVVHVPNAHTDGDVIVKFRKADVLFAADLFNNGDYTRIDSRGGSLDGMIAAYQKLLPTLDDSVKVVPGRGRVGTKKDLEEYLQVMIALRTRMTALIKDGKTVEECVAAKPTDDFDAHWANGPIRPDQLVEELYADLKPKIR
ncbi:MAG TPA: MBL fold metallo-hydrolase [Micropepsaceae bacterium]|nr:MBL fold metallo-hydrolase [Micropepsaceae bacterium]